MHFLLILKIGYSSADLQDMTGDWALHRNKTQNGIIYTLIT